MSNYIEPVKEQLLELGCDETLTALYTLLALVKGQDVTMKDVHDAWAVWKNNIDKEHKSLVPFERLDRATKNLDAEYANAIAEACQPQLNN